MNTAIPSVSTELRPQVGLAVLAFNKNRILLGKRKKKNLDGSPGVGDGCWQTPGGHLEFGESFEACSVRELREETDLLGVDPLVVQVTNNVFPEQQRHYVTVWMGLYIDNPETLVNLEPDKCEVWQWFDFDELPSPLFEASEVLDLRTLRIISMAFKPSEQGGK